MEEKVEENNSRLAETLSDIMNPQVSPHTNYAWTAYDPIVLQQKTIPIAQEGSNDRMDVLSASTLSRSRSLTRPERRAHATAVPRHKSNILTESTSQWGPWSIFFHAVTCCLPSVLLATIGGMHELEKQRAWREKVALCFICLFFCGILGFITFGLQDTICTFWLFLTISIRSILQFFFFFFTLFVWISSVFAISRFSDQWNRL